MYRLITALLLLVIPSIGAFADNLPVPSYWTSRRGEMKIYSIDARGNLTGEYTSRTPGIICQNMPFDVRGREAANAVRFTVVWKNSVQDCKSTTLWFGRVHSKSIRTWWVHTYLDSQGVVRRMRSTENFRQQP
jgi:hypothetical protein